MYQDLPNFSVEFSFQVLRQLCLIIQQTSTHKFSSLPGHYPPDLLGERADKPGGGSLGLRWRRKMGYEC